jgi:hypothetical protein
MDGFLSMSPFQLFLYVIAIASGLFVGGALWLLFWFWWNALKGYLSAGNE